MIMFLCVTSQIHFHNLSHYTSHVFPPLKSTSTLWVTIRHIYFFLSDPLPHSESLYVTYISSSQIHFHTLSHYTSHVLLPLKSISTLWVTIRLMYIFFSNPLPHSESLYVSCISSSQTQIHTLSHYTYHVFLPLKSTSTLWVTTRIMYFFLSNPHPHSESLYVSCISSSQIHSLTLSHYTSHIFLPLKSTSTLWVTIRLMYIFLSNPLPHSESLYVSCISSSQIHIHTLSQYTTYVFLLLLLLLLLLLFIEDFQALTHSRKNFALSSSCLSVCPHVQYQWGSHRTDFHKICFWWLQWKSVG